VTKIDNARRRFANLQRALSLGLGLQLGIGLGIALILTASPASADVTLVEKDGWTVYMNGRMQTFLSYATGQGFPVPDPDANGNGVNLLDGGQKPDVATIALEEGDDATARGTVQELRLRAGFVGNVLGFGIKNQLTPDTELSAYSAVTTSIISPSRRKYIGVIPDWRESYMRLKGPWGQVTAGRAGVLFSRGATEITYLYGFKYGLGWPGSISELSEGGTSAGMVGFGVLGNGFAPGVAYATPNLGGAVLEVGFYDANNYPNSAKLTRLRWPRAEAELTYEMELPGLGMFKLFGNGAWQKMYMDKGPDESTIYGFGYGGRVELGPVHLGLAGHMGKGVGIDFALQPHNSNFKDRSPDLPVLLRDMDGYSAHLQVKLGDKFDWMAAGGITRVHRLPEDELDTVDDDMDPNTPSPNDDGTPGTLDSVAGVPLKHNLGLSTGVTYHISDNLHLNLEYFRAMFEWYEPVPAAPGQEGETQDFDVISTGITFDF
jgi:hypothetical protein